MAKKSKTYNLTDKIDFGKYRGWLLIDLINRDLSYVQWCITNNDYFDITSDVQAYIHRITRLQNLDYYIFLTNKDKFLNYIDKYAEDAVLIEPISSQSVSALQLQFQF